MRQSQITARDEERLHSRLVSLADDMDAAQGQRPTRVHTQAATVRRATRGFALAAAAVVLMALIVTTRPSADDSDTSQRLAASERPPRSQPEPDHAEAVRRCQELLGTGDSGSPAPLPPDNVVNPGTPTRVLGPDCEIGIVDTGRLFHGPDGFLPIYPENGSDEVIAYWVSTAGWVTEQQAEDANWDVATVQAQVRNPYFVVEPSSGQVSGTGDP